MRQALTVVLTLLFAACAGAQRPPPSPAPQPAATPVYRYQNLAHPERSPDGMVAAQNRWSAAVGAEILAAGGNAVDAAVAVGFSLAVTLPRAGNIGGGGFMLMHDAATGRAVAIDFRETAPVRATRDMYLDENGEVDRQKAMFGHLASGVPGTVAGFWRAHRKYGRLSWEQVVEPAIRQARDGIRVSYDMAEILSVNRARYCRNEALCGYFYKRDGSSYEPGEVLVQSDLAGSLELIAAQGADAFYTGEIARQIVAEMERGGGLIDAGSLAAYEAAEREAVRGSYRGYDIVAMPPPSSGGVHVIQMLNVLENFDVAGFGVASADSIHLLTEAMRLAYADRSLHLGDPDHHDVPVEWLTSKAYAKALAATIDMTRAGKSADVAPGVEPRREGIDTTHLSVVDAAGNAALVTYTVNFSFGSGVAIPGAGFVLNNEMDDFVAKPGVPNAFGLVGSEANAIAAGKRPLSSMSPVMVFDGDDLRLATGSPGGAVIISAVLQLIVNVIDHGMNIAEATIAPRMHHQWFPDRLVLEPGFSPDTLRLLEERGHSLARTGMMMGSLQTVGYRDGVFVGASDTRRPNAGSVSPGGLQTQ
ncbi:MAG: gamma-glutamyltransferase [Proteobacteria bacterium]|nr:gamma-glutamyltransferase [Pseudomonadota bacterium]